MAGSKKHVPQRTCVACRQTGDKRQLVRLVRTPAAGVRIDETGKAHGRGAYLCRKTACWEKGLKGSLAHALKTSLSADDLAHLNSFKAGLSESV